MKTPFRDSIRKIRERMVQEGICDNVRKKQNRLVRLAMRTAEGWTVTNRVRNSKRAVPGQWVVVNPHTPVACKLRPVLPSIVNVGDGSM